MTKPTLVALAEAINEQFPELEGRALAVSEVDPFDKSTNIPTLPIAIAALVGETSDQGKTPELTSDILVQFVFEPVKYTTADGNDSPFFAFYDYETLRDRMISLTQDWVSPRGSVLRYVSIDVESDEFAVYIAIRFSNKTRWCQPKELAQAAITSWKIVYNMLLPSGRCNDSEQPTPADPCDAARLANPHSRENWTPEEAADHGPI